MSTIGRKMNILSNTDNYRLTRFIEINQENFKGKTQQRIADEANKELGLTVTTSNICGVAKTLGISLGIGHSVSGKVPSDINRTLARALSDLYKRLGEEVPPNILAIAQR